MSARDPFELYFRLDSIRLLTAVQYEDTAGSLWTDRAIDYLAGIGRLKLDTFIAALFAVRMILVIHRNLRNLGLSEGRVQCCGKDACCSYGAAQQRAPGKSCRSILRFA